MKLSFGWTISGDTFIIGDDEDERAPMIKVIMVDSFFKTMAIDSRKDVANLIARAMAATPHPYEEKK